MRHATFPNPRAALVVLAVALAPAGAAWAGEVAPATDPRPAQTVTAGSAGDPCTFYRTQAFGRGLEHFASEMLWACEAIAARRGGAIPLSERLDAMAGALERYRSALIEAGRQGYLRDREAGLLGLNEADKRELAERTGTLAALEAIRSGY